MQPATRSARIRSPPFLVGRATGSCARTGFFWRNLPAAANAFPGKTNCLRSRRRQPAGFATDLCGSAVLPGRAAVSAKAVRARGRSNAGGLARPRHAPAAVHAGRPRTSVRRLARRPAAVPAPPAETRAAYGAPPSGLPPAARGAQPCASRARASRTCGASAPMHPRHAVSPSWPAPCRTSGVSRPLGTRCPSPARGLPARRGNEKPTHSGTVSRFHALRPAPGRPPAGGL